MRSLNSRIATLITLLMLNFAAANLNGQGGTAAALAPVPSDIFPDSLSRLPLVKRADLDEAGKKVFDSSVGANGRMSGPAALSMYSPQMAEPIEALNRWLRKNGLLGPRLTELAILVAARELDQRYEWGGHEPAALRAAVEPAVIDVIRYNKSYASLSEKDATIVQLGRQLFRQRRVDSEIFAHAVTLFGKQGTFELATLMGDYAMVGIMLQAVDQQVAPDRPSNLPALAGVGPQIGKPGEFADPAVKPAGLPADVFADSLSRLPAIKREDLDEEGKRVWDVVVGRDKKASIGPVGLSFYSPGIAEQMHYLNEYLRKASVLGRPLIELSISVAGREMNHQFEWAAHSPAALKEGVPEAVINAVKYDRDVSGLGEKEATIIKFGRELFRDKKVSTATFSQSVKVFGRQGTVEIAGLMGNYYMVSLMLDVVGQQLNRGWEPTLPVRRH